MQRANEKESLRFLWCGNGGGGPANGSSSAWRRRAPVNAVMKTLSQPGPSGTSGRELQRWTTGHGNALRDAARCDAIVGSSQSGWCDRDRESGPVVTAEGGAVAAV